VEATLQPAVSAASQPPARAGPPTVRLRAYHSKVDLPRYATAQTAIGKSFSDPGYPGHYALIDTGQLAPDQLERLAAVIRAS
jgi:hypothetical protein